MTSQFIFKIVRISPLALVFVSSLLLFSADGTAEESLPAGVAKKLKNAASEHGAAALIDSLQDTLQEDPELAATSESAAELARAAAISVKKFRGANLPVYRDIAATIAAHAPNEKKVEIEKAAQDAVAAVAYKDKQVGVYPQFEQKDFKNDTSPEGKGIKVGSFLITPEIQAAEFYDSNIYATHSGRKGDFVNVITPHLLAKSQWDRHELDFEAHYDQARYADHVSENSSDYRVSGEGRYDFSDDLTKFFGGALYLQSHEERESPDDVLGTEPTIYHEARFYGGIEHNFDDWTARAGGTLEHLNFDDTPTSSSVINNTDRNRNHITYGGSVAYNTHGMFTPYLQTTMDVRRYDNNVDDNGYARDSSGYNILLGSDFTLSGGKLLGTAGVGIMAQDYDDATFSSVRSPAFSGNLRWKALPSVSLIAYADRAIDETTLVGASSNIYTETGATAEYTVTKDLLLSLRGQYSTSAFQDIPRTDHDYEGSIGLRYMLDKNWFVAGDYRHQVRNSDVQVAKFTREQVYSRIGFLY